MEYVRDGFTLKKLLFINFLTKSQHFFTFLFYLYNLSYAIFNFIYTILIILSCVVVKECIISSVDSQIEPSRKHHQHGPKNQAVHHSLPCPTFKILTKFISSESKSRSASSESRCAQLGRSQMYCQREEAHSPCGYVSQSVVDIAIRNVRHLQQSRPEVSIKDGNQWAI